MQGLHIAPLRRKRNIFDLIKLKKLQFRYLLCQVNFGNGRPKRYFPGTANVIVIFHTNANIAWVSIFNK